MNISFSAALPSDLPEVKSLLLSVFGAEAEAAFRLDLLHWKYFEPFPNDNGAREFVVKKDERMIAHCGIYPVNIRLPNRYVKGFCFLDWASRYPGAGLSLYTRLVQQAEIGIVTGGSMAARAFMRRLEFSHYGDLEYYARVVRPWRQLRTRPSKDWRNAARFLRNLSWNVTTLPSPSKSWTVTRVQRFGTESCPGETSRAFTVTKRDPEVLNYWLRCPVGACCGLLMFHEGRPCGYALLNKLGGQARVIDIQINSPELSAWQAAYILATRYAMQDRDVCEVVAVASTPMGREALLRNGFRLRDRDPIYLYDPGKLLSGRPPLHWNLIDGDTALLHDPRKPYIS